MKQKIDRELGYYSTVDFQNDLSNLENDVNRRLSERQSAPSALKALVEKWFVLPASFSGSAMALTLAGGIFMGTQVQTDLVHDNHDTFGFQVFSATNEQLPSSLLVPKE